MTHYGRVLLISTALVISACNGGSGADELIVNGLVAGALPEPDAEDQSENETEELTPELEDQTPVIEPEPEVLSPLDIELIQIIEDNGLLGDASLGRSLPDISDPIPQLGRALFFSRSLGGEMDSACVTCHHPVLGGGDGLLLPVGVGAVQVDLIGPGREHIDGLPPVPRHSPTVFNVGLWDSSLFWDSRVESLLPVGLQNGAAADIRTPDTALAVADSDAGNNLAAAQARFPVTSAEEMRSDSFEAGADNNTVRQHLAARIGDYGIGAGEIGPNNWAAEFQRAFETTETGEQLVTFDRIAEALGEYERSMVFINNPWKSYVQGDTTALTEQQKEGAVLFFTPANQNGGGCSTCHSGDLFSDEEHHVVAFPQFGPGKGDGADGSEDFARERETNDRADRYRFRTPSLLNVAATAPYGHAGVYPSLNAVLNHYNNPNNSVDDFFDDAEWCDTEQFEQLANCETLYPSSRENSEAVLQQLNANRQNGSADFLNTNLNNNERNQIAAFLQALTDPCVLDRECLSAWIPEADDPGPDGNQLNAVDAAGNAL